VCVCLCVCLCVPHAKLKNAKNMQKVYFVDISFFRIVSIMSGTDAEREAGRPKAHIFYSLYSNTQYVFFDHLLPPRVALIIIVTSFVVISSL